MTLRAAEKHPTQNSVCGSRVVLEGKGEVWAENPTCPVTACPITAILILLSQKRFRFLEV